MKEKLYIARKIFKSRYGMTEFASNLKNNHKFKRTNWLSFCKEKNENENHILSGKCKVYGDLNKQYNEKEKSVGVFLCSSE